MIDLDLAGLRAVVGEQPYPLVFSTVSGAHLYGFPSRDSDVDLRGVHVLPVEEVVGLTTGPETLTRMWDRDGVELDLVTHDVVKFARMLLRRNGYVLEQLLSPLVVTTSPAHVELVALAPGCLTRHHASHYLGFADTQWRRFGSTDELKALLYTFRVLLTGIHLMRTGNTLCDLTTLADVVPEAPQYLDRLVAAKREAEHQVFDLESAVGEELVGRDVYALMDVLASERERTALPDEPSAAPALHDLVVRLRTA